MTDALADALADVPMDTPPLPAGHHAISKVAKQGRVHSIHGNKDAPTKAKKASLPAEPAAKKVAATKPAAKKAAAKKGEKGGDQRLMLPKNVYSRACHSALNKARREGMAEASAKESNLLAHGWVHIADM